MPEDGEGGRFDLDELLPTLQYLMEIDRDATMRLVQAMGSELAWATEQLARTSAENRVLRSCVNQMVNQVHECKRQLAVQVDYIWKDSDQESIGLTTDWLERMGILVGMLDGFSREMSESPSERE